MRKSVKILTATVCSAVVIAGVGACTYLYALPKLVSSAWLNKVAVKEAAEILNADLSIKNPKLATSFSPNVGFTLEELTLSRYFCKTYYCKKTSCRKYFCKRI